MLQLLDRRTTDRRQTAGRRSADAAADAAADLRARIARSTDAEFARRYAEVALRQSVTERLRGL